MIPLITSNISDYLARDALGGIVAEFDLSRPTPEQWKAVKSIQIETVVRGSGEDKREVEKVRLVLHDKTPALVAVSRLFGWLLDPAREPPPGAYEARLRQMTPEQRAEEGRKLIERAKQKLLEHRMAEEGTDLEPDGEGGFGPAD